jgi:superfamily II DNA or RNA helicase
MARLLHVDEIDSFHQTANVKPSEVTGALREAIRGLHEIDDMEELLRLILYDLASTPHGPAEIVDILTHKVKLDGQPSLAAFVLKGRSYPTVRPKDISHQLYRLEKIAGLKLAVLGTTGVVLDAVKEEFVSTCERLDIRYAIMDADDFARLFWAYGLMCPRDGTITRGARCHCGYAPKNARLNVIQKEALKALEHEHNQDRRRGLIVLPTGSGKTRVAAVDARRLGAQRVLYVAHSDEILEVAEAEFTAAYDAASVRRWNRARPGAAVSTTTIQFLSRHLDELETVRFDYAVIDEFHHAAAPSYRAAVARLDTSYLLGMTATPFRGDNQDIFELCDRNIVIEFDLRFGIDSGILTPYHYYGCFDEADYSGLSVLGGYSVADLERRIFIPERHRAITEKWLELSGGQKTLAFCSSHQHVSRVVEAFKARGVPAAAYLSTTPPDTRKQLIDNLRSGKLKILCVVDVLNEGADIPFVECLLFLRPTESKRIFLQQLGRGLRHYVGKSHCLVIDFIGNFRNAYQVIEYHDLRADQAAKNIDPRRSRSVREILDLPLNCKIEFDDRVLDLFADQALDFRHATRANIGRILIHRYLRLSRGLGRPASAKDIDRNELLDSSFYKRVFGSWKKFINVIQESYPGETE